MSEPAPSWTSPPGALPPIWCSTTEVDRSPASRSATTRSSKRLAAAAWASSTRRRTKRLRRTVALKALTPEYTRDPIRRERLKREAQAAAALSHPAIATIFALEEIDGELYIVSELVRGRTLREELGDGPLPPAQLGPVAHRHRERARGRARTGNRPSRSEAGKHHSTRGRADQGARLRPGAERVSPRGADPDAADRRGFRTRDARIHGSRATERRRSRCPRGRVRIRRPRLGTCDGRASIWHRPRLGAGANDRID